MDRFIVVSYDAGDDFDYIDNNQITLINADSHNGQTVIFDHITARPVWAQPQKTYVHILNLPEVFVKHVANGVPLDFAFSLQGNSVEYKLDSEAHKEISMVLGLKKI